MVSRKNYYHSIQRQSRCKDHIYVLDTIRAADMDETYGNYLCCCWMFDIHDYDDDTDHDTDDDTDDDSDDDTNDDTADDTHDVGGRGNLCTIKVPGGKLVYLESGSRS